MEQSIVGDRVGRDRFDFFCVIDKVHVGGEDSLAGSRTGCAEVLDDKLDEKLLIRSDARQRLSTECLQEHVHCDLGRIGYRYCKRLGIDVSSFVLQLENSRLRPKLIGNWGPGDQSCLLIDGHSCRCVVQDIPQSLALFRMVQVETKRGPNIGSVRQIAQGDGRGSKGVVFEGQRW